MLDQILPTNHSSSKMHNGSTETEKMGTETDTNCLFSLELCVDTVDFFGANSELPAEEAIKEVKCSLGFIFLDYPPIVLSPPLDKSTVSWYCKKGEKRLRQVYQVGQSALFEEEPLEMASKLSSQSLMLLAIGEQEKGTTQYDVLGSAGISLESFVPPQTQDAGRHRFGYLRGSWGCSEMVVPLKDYSGNTIALALVVISISAVDPSLKQYITQNKTENSNVQNKTSHVLPKDITNTMPTSSLSHGKVPMPQSLNIPSHSSQMKFSQVSNTPTSAPTTGQGSLKISWDNTPTQRGGQPSKTPHDDGFSDMAVSPNLTPPPSASPTAGSSSSSSSSSSSLSSSMNSNLSQSFNHVDRQFVMNNHQPLSESGDVLEGYHQVSTIAHLKPLRSSVGHEPETQSRGSNLSTPTSQSPVWLGGDGEGLPGLRMSASGTGFKQSAVRMSGSGIGFGESIQRRGMKDSFEVGPVDDSPPINTVSVQEEVDIDEQMSLKINNYNFSTAVYDESSYQLPSTFDGVEPDRAVVADRQESYHYQPKPLFFSNTDVPHRSTSTTTQSFPIPSNNSETRKNVPVVASMSDISNESLRLLEEKLSRIEAKLTSTSTKPTSQTNETTEPTHLLKRVMDEMGQLGDQSVLRNLFIEIAKLQADSSSLASSSKNNTVVNNQPHVRQSQDKLRLRTLPVRSRPHLHRYTPQVEVPPYQEQTLDHSAHEGSNPPPPPPKAPPFTPGVGERMDEWFGQHQDDHHMVLTVEYAKILAAEMRQTDISQILTLCESMFGQEDKSKLNYARAMSLLSEVVSGTS